MGLSAWWIRIALRNRNEGMVYRICACKSSIVLEIVVSELMTFTGNFSLKIPRSSEKTGVIEQKLFSRSAITSTT